MDEDAPRELSPVDGAGIGWNEEALTISVPNEPLHLPWHQVAWLTAEHPWPGLRLRWRAAGVLHSARLVPAQPADAGAVAARIAELFAYVRANIRGVEVAPGWLDFAELEWEKAEWPMEPTRDDAAAGAFRTSAPPPRAGPVIAHRTRRTPLEVLLDWLASRPGLEWRAQPIEIAATTTHLFARTRRGVVKAPLVALARVDVTKDGDVVATFGRKTRIVLPHRQDCAVATLLRARAPKRPG